MHSQCGKYQVLRRPHCECIHTEAHGDSRYLHMSYCHHLPHCECVHNAAHCHHLPHPERIQDAAFSMKYISGCLYYLYNLFSSFAASWKHAGCAIVNEINFWVPLDLFLPSFYFILIICRILNAFRMRHFQWNRFLHASRFISVIPIIYLHRFPPAESIQDVPLSMKYISECLQIYFCYLYNIFSLFAASWTHSGCGIVDEINFWKLLDLFLSSL